MKKTLLVLLLTGVVLSTSYAQQGFASPDALPVWARPDKTNIIYELSRDFPVWLVQVQAVKLTPIRDEEMGDYNLISFKITHVFAGVESIAGSTFEVSSHSDDAHGIRRLNLKLGEEAIYCVTPKPKLNITPLPSSVVEARQLLNSFYGNSFPIQQTDPEYPAILAFAHSIERVAKAPRPEQIRLLESYARSSDLRESFWAITTVAYSTWEGSAKFLLELISEPNISVLNQVRIDQKLDALDIAGKVKWNSTPLRAQLWQRLVTSPANDEDAGYIVSRLTQIGHTQEKANEIAKAKGEQYLPQINQDQLFEWLRLAANNTAWSARARARARAVIPTP